VSWILNMDKASPVAWAVLVIMVVAVAGMALASIKIKGVGMGIAGVLFAGIIANGYCHLAIEKPILEFVRDFGLILFVYTIGLQLGPGFFASFRKEGLKLNLMAVCIIVGGMAIALTLGKLMGVDIVASLGLFSGATTNTPSLGATTQTLNQLGGEAAAKSSIPAVAYAVAYPGGVFGIIAVMLVLQAIFGVDPEKEAAEFREEQKKGVEPLERINLLVSNSNVDNLPISQIPGHDSKVIVSRIKRASATEVETASEQTVLHKGDIILAVGTHAVLEKFKLVIGGESDVNLMKVPGKVITRKLVVTNHEVLGKTLDELAIDDVCGVVVTRVTRADMEVTAVPGLHLQFGDMLQVVGTEEAIAKAVKVVGNRIKALNETNFIPIFVGIALGVLIGSVPIVLPSLPIPAKLGIAGGPLIMAIILSRIGRIGPLVWYMPVNANLAFRELGIVLFLACVGLSAGKSFFDTVASPTGIQWLWIAFLITVVPIFIIGLVARLVFKVNYTKIIGLISGSMTDPPALAFANAISGSDAPSVAYATVYPLTMLLRILSTQLVVLLCCR
jgi:putative transport protein